MVLTATTPTTTNDGDMDATTAVAAAANADAATDAAATTAAAVGVLAAGSTAVVTATTPTTTNDGDVAATTAAAAAANADAAVTTTTFGTSLEAAPRAEMVDPAPPPGVARRALQDLLPHVQRLAPQHMETIQNALGSVLHKATRRSNKNKIHRDGGIFYFDQNFTALPWSTPKNAAPSMKRTIGVIQELIADGIIVLPEEIAGWSIGCLSLMEAKPGECEEALSADAFFVINLSDCSYELFFESTSMPGVQDKMDVPGLGSIYHVHGPLRDDYTHHYVTQTHKLALRVGLFRQRRDAATSLSASPSASPGAPPTVKSATATTTTTTTADEGVHDQFFRIAAERTRRIGHTAEHAYVQHLDAGS